MGSKKVHNVNGNGSQPFYINPGFQSSVSSVVVTPQYVDDSRPDTPTEKDSPERGQWGSKAEFLLSCIGLSVGIGNIWRFPFLAYQNGGGAFLLPYVILMLLVGKPLYFMEVAIGQFSSLGPMSVWRCLPIAKGVGIAMLMVSIAVAVYYNVILAYTVFYMAQSFRSTLPWEGCFEWWGATNETCYVRSSGLERCAEVANNLVKQYINSTSKPSNDWSFVVGEVEKQNATAWVPTTVLDARYMNCTKANKTASELFWERYVLGITDGIEDIGYLRWDLTLCLLASWVVVFLCLMKGVKSSGKVVYFTATFPYLVLLILLVRGVTLNGALTGIKYFFIPQWDKLLDIGIWRKAAEQLFYSLSISWGGIIMFGSYNKFNNPVHRDALLISTMDFITSLIGGVVIFSVLGYMAEELGVGIEHVAQAGQGLAFVVYPEALSRLVVPQLWSVLFFFMLFLLGLDSEFALLETVLTALYDEVPKSRNYKVPLTFGLCAVCFLIGLPCVAQGGQYILNLMDTYAGGISIIFIAICEVTALMWLYGFRRFCDDIKLMIGKSPNWYWKSSWLFFSPIILAFLFVYGLYDHKPIMYGDVKYPKWADGLGWLLALISMVQIPLWAAIVLFKYRKNPGDAFKPLPNWGPGDPDEFKSYHANQDRVFQRTEKFELPGTFVNMQKH